MHTFKVYYFQVEATPESTRKWIDFHSMKDDEITVDVSEYKHVTDIQAVDNEDVFHILNGNYAHEIGVRSMTVGDIVYDTSTGIGYMCKTIGWKKFDGRVLSDIR